MHPFFAVILGIIQGLTEFLPVSSSGHLVILQHLFGMRSPELVFDIAVHLGTLMAVVIFFRSDLTAMAMALIKPRGNRERGAPLQEAETYRGSRRLFWLILIGTIPTGILGLTIHFWAGEIFASPLFAGIMLLITGLLLITTRKHAGGDKTLADMTTTDALSIGLIQGFAVFPGISRSGSTIATALFLGLQRDAAARFSFLLSIPSILAASLLILKDVSQAPAATVQAALIGAAASVLIGYAALRFLVFIVHRGRLYVFAPYCWALGILGIGVALMAGGQ